MDSSVIGFIAVLVVMLLMSAYFSATETAFTSINRIRIKNLAKDGNKRAAQVLALSDRFDVLLSTILIGNNIVNIASASIATVVFVRYFGNAGVTISTAVMTVLVLIFGEISPKSLAKDSPESFAMFAAPFIRFLMFILTPVNFLFMLWKKCLINCLRLMMNAA
jgi:Putative Mg2+ and Co2+ transporter CorB